MKEQKDYLSYLIGLGGIFLTILSISKEDMQRIIFLIWGAAALVVAVVMIYIDKFINKLQKIENQVKGLKKEYEYSKQINDLKMEIEKFKKNKRAKADIEDLIKIGFLIIVFYLILKGLGIIN